MSHFKKKNKTKQFHIVVVKPEHDFCPVDWRQKPTTYEIIEYCGCKRLRGQADTWRFLHNQPLLKQQSYERWGMVIDDQN